MTLLRFGSVTCVRGGRLLLEKVSFTLAPGEALVVSGPNGAGKSSLIRVAAGLLPPAAGRVERSEAALLAEAAALDEERGAAAALAFWAAVGGAVMAPAEALAAVGLGHLAAVPVRLLSTGQRRRVALARVAMSGAPLWLLDEPANGLDAEAVALLEGLVERHRAGGGAALVATHLPLALAGARHLVLGP